MQTLWTQASERPSCLYMSPRKESIAFAKEILSDSRIQIAFLQRKVIYKRADNVTLVAIETKCAGKSLERVLVSRKEELDDLIAAFGRRVHEEHPNPDRVGCPGQLVLSRLANQPETFQADSILDHVKHCAACLDELGELRVSSKRSQRW